MLHLLHELDLPPGRQVQLPGNTRGGEALIVVARALERSCADGPVLLALDDLQWSDAATRDLVHYGIARLADVPLGWLLTTRPEPLLAGFLHRLGQEAQVDRVELAPFTAAETLELISAVTGDAEDAASLADTLVARSEGNPFFLVELLRALNSDRSGTPQVPESIIAAVLERTERLPHATQEVLTWFAVLPQPVDPMPLHRLAPDTDLEGSLGLLAANRLLAPDADRDLVVHRN
jgi:predicted ATPase